MRKTQPPNAGAATGDQDHLATDVLLKHGLGQEQLDHLDQGVVQGHHQAHTHLHDVSNHLSSRVT